jgi:hypothetical protein
MFRHYARNRPVVSRVRTATETVGRHGLEADGGREERLGGGGATRERHRPERVAIAVEHHGVTVGALHILLKYQSDIEKAAKELASPLPRSREVGSCPTSGVF